MASFVPRSPESETAVLQLRFVWPKQYKSVRYAWISQLQFCSFYLDCSGSAFYRLLFMSLVVLYKFCCAVCIFFALFLVNPKKSTTFAPETKNNIVLMEKFLSKYLLLVTLLVGTASTCWSKYLHNWTKSSNFVHSNNKTEQKGWKIFCFNNVKNVITWDTEGEMEIDGLKAPIISFEKWEVSKWVDWNSGRP